MGPAYLKGPPGSPFGGALIGNVGNTSRMQLPITNGNQQSWRHAAVNNVPVVRIHKYTAHPCSDTPAALCCR